VTDSAIQERIESLLSRPREGYPPPTAQEIADVYTDGCAKLLLLAAEDLRTKRRLKAAVVDAGSDAQAAGEIRELTERRATLGEQARRLRAQLPRLRAALVWAQRRESARATIDTPRDEGQAAS
jgi:hypothetical protein